MLTKYHHNEPVSIHFMQPAQVTRNTGKQSETFTKLTCENFDIPSVMNNWLLWKWQVSENFDIPSVMNNWLLWEWQVSAPIFQTGIITQYPSLWTGKDLRRWIMIGWTFQRQKTLLFTLFLYCDWQNMPQSPLTTLSSVSCPDWIMCSHDYTKTYLLAHFGW